MPFVDLSAMELARKRKICKEFGSVLEKLRKEKNLSLRELAAEVGMEHAHIARMEKGGVNPSITTVIALAEALSVKPALFFSSLL